MSINVVDRVDDLVKVRHVLVSVSDKQGLDRFVPELVRLNSELRIFSTGGTFTHLQKILGDAAGRHLTQVSDYTGQPETQGGLVKTLDFKIYLGLLTETPGFYERLAVKTKAMTDGLVAEAKRAGVPAISLGEQMRGGRPYFADSTHFSERGEELAANIILAAIRDELSVTHAKR